MVVDTEPRLDRLIGVLLGTAVGDAIGLPREGLSRRRALRMYGAPPLEHRLVLSRGMVSDDTEHACMTAQALLASRARGGDPAVFARSLAWRLRGWFATLPGGIGFGTLRALFKLWLFFPPEKSGVRSAGNGPAMRAPIIGAAIGDGDFDRLERHVLASTRLTHRDVRAEQGAILIGLAAAHGARLGGGALDPGAYLAQALRIATDPELHAAIEKIEAALARDASLEELANELGLERGVTGYTNHTVPIVLYAWLRHRGSFRDAVEETIALGGDSDTTGAIVGGLMGATLGASSIPESWLRGLWEWPRTVDWMRRLASRLATADQAAPLPLFWPALLPRNLLFIAIVLAHGFRRLLPPY